MPTTPSDITITDSDTATDKVNGGTAIVMQGASGSYSVGVFTQVVQQPAKSIDQSHNDILAYGDYLGFDNPILSITGIINLNDYDASSGAAPDDTINVKFLQQIMKSGHIFTITDKYDDGTTSDIYRLHSLSGTFPDETVSAITVQCTGLSIITNASDSIDGAKINYTITFKEVRS